MPRQGSLTRRNRDIQTLTADNRVVPYVRASTPSKSTLSMPINPPPPS